MFLVLTSFRMISKTERTRTESTSQMTKIPTAAGSRSKLSCFRGCIIPATDHSRLLVYCTRPITQGMVCQGVVQLDRIGYQPRLHISPFLRYSHNLNSSTVVARYAYCVFSTRYSYQQPHCFHALCIDANVHAVESDEEQHMHCQDRYPDHLWPTRAETNSTISSLTGRTRYALASIILTLVTPRFPGLPPLSDPSSWVRSRVALMLAL